MVSISSLLVVVLISLLATRVATIALIATGLSREIARFQARSGFTGTGFATSEAEAVGHAVRRGIVLVLILAGNAGLAAVVASLMLGFTRGGSGAAGYRILELPVELLVLLALARSRHVDRRLAPFVARLLSRYTDLKVRDYAGLLELEGGYRVIELAVEPEDWMAGRTLAELRLRDEGVVVLGLSRRGEWRGAPAGQTRVEAVDTLVLYGLEEAVCELDERERGSSGEAAHARAVALRKKAA
ncbi:MAG TPA: TrkA C-terminal domain-containing protein [Gaiellaceae bacterium]|nr:TrkA C-terminal domain-containing protein [Gaiellaceae bacterium]